MIRRIAFVFTLLLVAPFSAAGAPRLSQTALPFSFTEDSPIALRQPFENLDPELVPEWSSLEALNQTFDRMRDLRFLHTPARPRFGRRISWLFPDDGCNARAALARQQIEDVWSHRIAKLYIFGSLYVRTVNSPRGYVLWEWHVVPVVNIAGTLYVMDPAINPESPLTAEDWALRQVSSLANATFAICTSYSYDPGGACRTASAGDEGEAATDQQWYLQMEWSRLEELNRDPEQELGDAPPWGH